MAKLLLSPQPRAYFCMSHLVVMMSDEPAQANRSFSYTKKWLREDDLWVRGQLSELSGGLGGRLGQPGPPEGSVRAVCSRFIGFLF